MNTTNCIFLASFGIRPFPSYPATGRIIHTETSSVQALSLSRERNFFLITEDQITGARLPMVAEVPEATHIKSY